MFLQLGSQAGHHGVELVVVEVVDVAAEDLLETVESDVYLAVVEVGGQLHDTVLADAVETLVVREIGLVPGESLAARVDDVQVL